ncbi:hypothetical protein M0R04_08900 [Candidatus Dojkabacteria bacterium]|jgi:hypothetical protein|nr:hypothetical protein [Candidatus Dojkabacteria bacterium]
MSGEYQYQVDPLASMGAYAQDAYGAPYSQDGYGTEEYYDPAEEQEEEQFLGFSEGKPREGLYALFNKVLTLPKSTKVGNVDKHELGDLGISVREGLRVALIGETFGHPVFAKFFTMQSNIVTDSSMAKKGWFTELFVTSKRFAERTTGSLSRPAGQVPGEPQSKWSKLFGGSKQAAPPQQ